MRKFIGEKENSLTKFWNRDCSKKGEDKVNFLRSCNGGADKAEDVVPADKFST